jgi:hypothetical protein
MQINGEWHTVTSPHVVDDQSLKSGVEVRAIDKAGNIRMGTFVPSTVIQRQTSYTDYLVVFIVLLLLIGALYIRRHLNKKAAVQAQAQEGETVDLRS